MWTTAADHRRLVDGARPSAAADDSTGRAPTAPVELVLAGTFVGLLVLCAAFSLLPGLRHDGLALLCAFVAVMCWWASPMTAVAVGTLAWPFYLGWVVRDDGQLVVHGGTEPIVLAVFLGIAIVVVAARRALTWLVRCHAAGAVTGPVRTVSLLYGFPAGARQASEHSAPDGDERREFTPR